MPSKDICNENDSLHDSEGSSAKPDSHRISNQSQPQGSAKPFVDKPEEEASINVLGASKLPEMSSKDMCVKKDRPQDVEGSNVKLDNHSISNQSQTQVSVKSKEKASINILGASKLPEMSSKDMCIKKDRPQDGEGSSAKPDSHRISNQSQTQGPAKPSVAELEEKSGINFLGASKLPVMFSKDMQDSEGSNVKLDSHSISNQSQTPGSAKPFVDKPEEEAGINVLGASKLPKMSSKDMCIKKDRRQDVEGSSAKSDSHSSPIESLAQGPAKPSGTKPEEKASINILGASKLPEMSSKDICDEKDRLQDTEGSNVKPDNHNSSDKSHGQGPAKPSEAKPDETVTNLESQAQRPDKPVEKLEEKPCDMCNMMTR